MGIKKLTSRRAVSPSARSKSAKIIQHVASSVDPEAIYLIGSFQSGVVHDDSDLDLVVLINGPLNRQALALKVHPTRPHKDIPLDLHFVTVADWKKSSDVGGICFEAKHHVSSVYERSAQ